MPINLQIIAWSSRNCDCWLTSVDVISYLGICWDFGLHPLVSFGPSGIEASGAASLSVEELDPAWGAWFPTPPFPFCLLESAVVWFEPEIIRGLAAITFFERIWEKEGFDLPPLEAAMAAEEVRKP